MKGRPEIIQRDLKQKIYRWNKILNESVIRDFEPNELVRLRDFAGRKHRGSDKKRAEEESKKYDKAKNDISKSRDKIKDGIEKLTSKIEDPEDKLEKEIAKDKLNLRYTAEQIKKYTDKDPEKYID